MKVATLYMLPCKKQNSSNMFRVVSIDRTLLLCLRKIGARGQKRSI